MDAINTINTPINPKEVLLEADGKFYVCGRCGAKFREAPRCPECGQLVILEQDDLDDVIYTIEEIEELFDSYGITYNSVKGPYRIMGRKDSSSLNLNKKNYVIYSSDEDFRNIEAAGFHFDDLELIKNGNSKDGSRPNTVKCHKRSTLHALLGIYAKNANNKL